MEFTITNSTRFFRHETGDYLIRDVWDADGKFERCEYGTCSSQDGGSVEWTPCAEGVEFSAISPITK